MARASAGKETSLETAIESRDRDARQGIEDDPGRGSIEIERPHLRNRDSRRGGRTPQCSHHSQPILGVVMPTVPLERNLLAAGQGDDVGAVLKPPSGCGRLGDRLPEHSLNPPSVRITVCHDRPP